jgi:hypothetical protein
MKYKTNASTNLAFYFKKAKYHSNKYIILYEKRHVVFKEGEKLRIFFLNANTAYQLYSVDAS